MQRGSLEPHDDRNGFRDIHEVSEKQEKTILLHDPSRHNPFAGDRGVRWSDFCVGCALLSPTRVNDFQEPNNATAAECGTRQRLYFAGACSSTHSSHIIRTSNPASRQIRFQSRGQSQAGCFADKSLPQAILRIGSCPQRYVKLHRSCPCIFELCQFDPCNSCVSEEFARANGHDRNETD